MHDRNGEDKRGNNLYLLSYQKLIKELTIDVKYCPLNLEYFYFLLNPFQASVMIVRNTLSAFKTVIVCVDYITGEINKLVTS